MNDLAPLRTIGSTAPRVDADLKVTGAARYTTDLELPRMLHAKTLRSPHAHARVVSIDVKAARAMPGVHAIITRDELKGLNPTYGYFIKDMPIVAIDKVRYIGDTVAAVAAETEEQAVRALERIEVRYEVLPTVATIEDALKPDAPLLFETPQPGIVPHYGTGASGFKDPARNTCYRFCYTTGGAAAFARADHVFTDEFRFSRMQHYHLEPFVTLARIEAGQIEVWTSTQSPFALRKELARVFNHPEQAIRVHVPLMGAGYGGKNNCKTEPIAILLAKLAGRPVRYCMTQEENFLTQSQHAAIHLLETAVMKDGRFVARRARVLLDAGAYSDASPLVAEKAGYRSHGPYRWEYIDSAADCVMTNTPPAGPFRGFGGTQASWASESQIDMIARRLGIDPVALRKKNLLKLREPYCPGESGMDSDLAAGLDLVCRDIGYGRGERKKGRGIGVAIGFKDSGGINKPAAAVVKATTTGGIIIGSAAIEMGQGLHSALSRIVAELFNADPARVSYAPVNTDVSPFDQGTNASSGIVVTGVAVERAARDCVRQVLEFAAAQLNCASAELRLQDWSVVKGNEAHPLMPMIMRHFGGTGFEFAGHGYFKAPNDANAPLETQCVSWEFGWGAAEVEVDEETGKVTLLQLVVSGDAGRAIDKAVCRGQDEGAAVMGLGQALFEGMQYDGAVLANIAAAKYRVPLASDLPEQFRSITQEQGHGPGPFGAKGMGEGGLLPVAPAIANAIEDAVGVRIASLPLSPEKVLAALAAKRAGAKR